MMRLAMKTAFSKLPRVCPAFRSGFIIIVLLVLSALSNAAAEENYLKNAEEFFSKGEYAAAEIQLRNALILEPDNAQAYLLRGKIYLEAGEGGAASNAIGRARDLGLQESEWLAPLAKAYLLLNRNDDVIGMAPAGDLDSATLQAELLQLQGQAYLAKQQFDMAGNKFSKALDLQPDLVDALLGKARIDLQQQHIDSADSYIDRVLAIDAGNTIAWTLKGELMRKTGRQRAAADAFEKAVELEPRNLTARIGRSAARIALGESGKVTPDLEQLVKTHPQMYLAHYLLAQALYLEQQTDLALETVQRALELEPDHLPSQLLAGKLAYQVGRLEQAEEYLSTALKISPSDGETARMLAATLLKLGKPDKAVEVWRPEPPLTYSDAEYLALLGSAYVEQGMAGLGMQYLETAVAAAPDSAEVRNLLATARLEHGEIEQGIKELENAIDLGQNRAKTHVLLVMGYLDHRDFDKALTAIGPLTEALPESPVPDYLRGLALLGKGEHKMARDAFESALAIQPGFVPGHMKLARLDLLAGDYPAANRRYSEVLAYNENNLGALLALAVLADRNGADDETKMWLRQAYEAHPDALKPALLLARHYLFRGELPAAREIARKLLVEHPRDAVVLEMTAQVQLMTGDFAEATNTLQTLVEITPDSHAVYYQLAMAQLGAKQLGAARQSLLKAIRLQPDFPQARMALGRLYIASRDFNSVSGEIRILRRTRPDAAFGDELAGDLHSARGEHLKAADAYAIALGKDASTPLVAKLSAAYLKAGEAGPAHDMLRQWLSKHPEDLVIRTLLARSQQDLGMHEDAVADYLKVLEQDPGNLEALNNVALLYTLMGSSEGIEYARHAYERAPQRADVIDTLGWTLLQSGDRKRGLVLLQEAALKAPRAPEIHYHLAVALDMEGRRDEAREVLDRLLATGETFQALDDAKALRERLEQPEG